MTSWGSFALLDFVLHLCSFVAGYSESFHGFVAARLNGSEGMRCNCVL